MGKTMVEHLHFSAYYWHNFCWDGAVALGQGIFKPSCLKLGNPMQRARKRADVAFTFFSKLNIPYYCFHDIDRGL